MTASSTAHDVHLRIPASPAYVSLARAATSATCARLGFSLEQLEDLTLAVDEAISLLLKDAVPGTDLHCRWSPGPDTLTVAVTSVSASRRTPREGSFAWMVLSALTDAVTATSAADEVTVSLTATKSKEAVQ